MQEIERLKNETQFVDFDILFMCVKYTWTKENGE